MTRFIWDKFSKDFLETLLSPYGTVVVSKEVTSEIKEIDVYFSPNISEIPSQLGLLGKLCQNPCLLEPYRNGITLDGINDCLSKRFAIREIFHREAKRNKQRISEEEIPKLWILTPTASERILSLFKAQLQPNWGEGVYFLPEGLGTAIVVIHQLPAIPETLWLRLLGRGGTRERAIDELTRLSPNAPLKSASLNLLYNLSRNLEALSKKTQEDREFIMRLAPLYQQDREQAVQQGEQRGEAKLVLRQLQRRFGEIPQNLEETIRKLPVERLEDLGLALLDFNTLTDLDNWFASVTRFIWDKFSKDFLETLLSPYGTVVVSKEVTSEIKEIDVYFSPNISEIPSQLGLLGKLCQNPCLLEPYRNGITLDGINDCLSKRFAIREIFHREAKRNKQRISEEEIPKLWILTPTASERILSLFTAQLQPNWGEGVYFLPEGLGTAIVVIHQLPAIPETLWLRLLGRGGTRERAIDELERLSPNAPLKSASLNLLYNLSRNLEALSKKTQEDREFIMRLAPLYQQDREQAVQQGEQRGEAKLVLRQLQRRFGEIPQNLEETIRKLPVERLEDLGLALLDFNTLTDLDNWLHP